MRAGLLFTLSFSELEILVGFQTPRLYKMQYITITARTGGSDNTSGGVELGVYPLCAISLINSSANVSVLLDGELIRALV